MPRPSRRLVAWLALVTLAACTAGCGVPVDASPSPLPKNGVPFRLLEQAPPSTSSTTTTTTPVPNQVLVHIYLLAPDGRLVSRDRMIKLPLGAGLDAVINALLGGPSPAEAAQGLQSAIPSQTRLLSTAISGTTATIDLNAVFGQQLVGPAQIPAVAQLVYTATAQSGIAGVAFEVAGQPVPVPVAGGAQVPVAVRSDFPNLAPATPSPPTTRG